MRTSRRTACVALSCVCLLARTQALVLPAAGGTPRRFARHATSRPIMAESSSQPATVDITQLLGCCVCACERAAAVIRAVESKRRSATTGAIEGAVLKDASDSRSYLTEADTAAQKVIMQTLRGAFPAVTIIGEEDEEEADTTEAPAAPGLSATAARVASEFEGAPASLRAVPAGDVCVFVDPVDGTKEFVEGRLGAVQTLIGVSVQGNAVAGAVGIPFMPPYAGEGSGTHVMYGIADVGARNIPAPTGQRPEVDGGAVLVASPSGKEKALGIAKESLKPGAVITPGAPARRARVPPLSPNHPTHTCTHKRGRKLCDSLHPSPPSPPSLSLPPSVWQGAWATKSSACCAGTLIVR